MQNKKKRYKSGCNRTRNWSVFDAIFFFSPIFTHIHSVVLSSKIGTEFLTSNNNCTTLDLEMASDKSFTFKNSFPKTIKWHWNYYMSFSCLRYWNIIKIVAYFVTFYQLFRWYVLKMAWKCRRMLPRFTEFSGKRLIYLHKRRKHFTQFVQFLFFFYLTFFSLEWFTQAPSENINFVILAAILYCWSHFICSIANRMTLKSKICNYKRHFSKKKISFYFINYRNIVNKLNNHNNNNLYKKNSFALLLGKQR